MANMSNFIEITNDVLKVDAITEQVTAPNTGAVSIFVGTTRDHFQGKKVKQLEYEAFVPMAKKELGKVCDKIRAKWSVHNIAIYHRLGTVGLKEASVIIAVTSEHRKESLEAVHYAIDELKATAPIWKKEVYEDGDGEKVWKENKECKWAGKKRESEEDEELEVDEDYVDPKFIQITASGEEVNRRIQSFMDRKREEINQANVLEFCNRFPSEEGEHEFSCARVDSIVPKKKGGSSHLRHSVVVNESGPQTNDYMDKSYDPLTDKMVAKKIKKEEGEKDKSGDLPVGIKDRVEGLETKLGENRPIGKDIYQRLKALEERVNYLEGVSPEYFNASLLDKKTDSGEADKQGERKKDNEKSLSAINTRIQELQASLSARTEKE